LRGRMARTGMRKRSQPLIQSAARGRSSSPLGMGFASRRSGGRDALSRGRSTSSRRTATAWAARIGQPSASRAYSTRLPVAGSGLDTRSCCRSPDCSSPRPGPPGRPRRAPRTGHMRFAKPRGVWQMVEAIIAQLLIGRTGQSVERLQGQSGATAGLSRRADAGRAVRTDTPKGSPWHGSPVTGDPPGAEYRGQCA